MKWSSIQTRVVLSLLVVTPLGFAFKFYPGPGNGWFNNYGAGVLYEVFWILLASLFFPSKRSANVIPVYVFVMTCILEFLQLWHPPFLEVIRSFFFWQCARRDHLRLVGFPALCFWMSYGMDLASVSFSPRIKFIPERSEYPKNAQIQWVRGAPRFRKGGMGRGRRR